MPKITASDGPTNRFEPGYLDTPTDEEREAGRKTDAARSDDDPSAPIERPGEGKFFQRDQHDDRAATESVDLERADGSEPDVEPDHEERHRGLDDAGSVGTERASGRGAKTAKGGRRSSTLRGPMDGEPNSTGR